MSNIVSLEINKKKIEIPKFVSNPVTLPIDISIYNANNTTYTFDLTNYLPKDNNKYKVLFTGEIRIETTDPLGGVACISIKGSEHDFVRICGGTKEYNNTFPNYIDGNGEIIIGTDRKLHIQRASVWFGSLYFFRMIGYTKIV